MKPTRQTAWALLLLLLALLLFGTQMPGVWRDEAFRVTHLSWQLTKVVHFVLFATLAANRNPTWHDVLLDQAGATLGLLGVDYTDRQLKSWK